MTRYAPTKCQYNPMIQMRTLWYTNMDEQTEAIYTFFREHQEALNGQDFAKVRAMFALDDECYRVIERTIPMPIESDVTSDILDWLVDNPGFKVAFNYSDIQVFNLADTVSYAVMINEWANDRETGLERLTYILKLSDEGMWRIVHFHRSEMPEEE